MKPPFVMPGSEARHASGGSWLPVDAGRQMRATIVIRRPPGAEDISQQLLSGSWHPMSREQAENLLRVDPADITAVLTFVHNEGLTVVSQNPEARTVQIEGTTAQVGQAFGVEIQWHIDRNGQKYLSYQGSLTLPSELEGVVQAVLGLDQRPIARHAGV